MSTGSTGEDELRRALSAVEGPWRRLRWAGALLTVVQFALYRAPPGLAFPLPQLPTGLALVAVIAATNLAARRVARVDDVARARRLHTGLLAVDGLVVMSAVWLFAFDAGSSQLWVLLELPVLGAALLWLLPGALWAWALAATGYVLRDLWAAGAFGRPFPLDAVTFRMGLLLLFAGIMGSLAATLSGLLAELRRSRVELAHQASHDPLTGLPNRVLFDDRLAQAVAQAERDRSVVGVLFVDCDNLKAVNDRFGHEAGDRLLLEVAARVREGVRPGDTVARMGGDEFTVLLERLERSAEAIAIAERILRRLREPWDVAGTWAPLSVSIGIAVRGGSAGGADGAHPTAGELLRIADAAMYTAKRAGKQRWVLGEAPT